MGSTAETILLFGDQTSEFASSLRHVVASARTSSRLTRKFLRDALDTVQIELRQLPGHETDIPKDDYAFTRLLDEPELFEELEDRMGTMQTVMTCIARLGELILRVEQDSSLLRPDNKIHAVGLCTGLLSAAALAAATSLEDLLNLAVLMVGISFRLRVALHYRTVSVESANAAWGYLIVGMHSDEAEAELARFHTSEDLPIHKRAYVAVAADTWVTVFGAPSTMKRLLRDSALFSRASSMELYRASGAVHASHLPAIDLKKIAGKSVLLEKQLSRSVRVYSTSACTPYDATTLFELMEEILQDILNRRLELTDTMDAAASALPRGCEARVISIGADSAVASLQQALERKGLRVSMVDAGQAEPERYVRGGSGKIAVVGMGGRFPGTDSSINGFWQSLLDGKEWHKRVPASRWELDAWQDALGPDAELPYGCFLEQPGEFDAAMFKISPREAAQMDPIQRLLLLATYEALESSGYAPESTSASDRRRISAFFGQSSDDWRDINHQQGIGTHYVPAVAHAFGAGRLHHFFKWEAGATTVDSACGSSAVAIITACQNLINRDCDMAVAGGGMLACSPGAYAGLAKGGFLSPTGSCKTFRDDIDGYCRGEAVAVVVLKRVEDAMMDNDNILGVIEGFARNHSAYASSITHPHQGSQERVFAEALSKASIPATDIGYVETHGTGTSAGDMCEVSAVANVLGKNRTADKPLIMGAVKANVGHGESAAAVVALIKALNVLKHGGNIPPQPGFNSNAQLNHEFPPLETSNIHVAHGAHRQLQSNQKVLVNCFDATGGNSCMVLARPPQKARQKVTDSRTHHVVVCSGHTFTAMKKNQRRLLDYVMANGSDHVRHLAYTTTARRMKHHTFRSAYVVQSMKELGLRLLEEQSNTDSTVRKAKSVAFAFTGQGACYRSMGRELFNTCPQFRTSIESCQAICDIHGFPSVLRFYTGAEQTTDAAQEQLALVALQIALVGMLRNWGLQPSVVVGHSIGEYAALYSAGVLSLGDTIYLVGKRTELLKQCCKSNTYSMLVIPLPRSDVEGLVNGKDFPKSCIACINTPNVTVCSGPSEEIGVLESRLHDQKGVKTTILPVAYGFHSAQMEEVAGALEKVARSATYNKPQVPVASTLNGQVVREEGVFSAAYMARQTRNAVDFVGAMSACRDEGLTNEQTLWVEVGPDAVCTSMVRGCGVTKDPKVLLPSLRSSESCWSTLNKLLAAVHVHGLDVNWKAVHSEFEVGLRLVELAPYAFDSTEYWWSYQSPAPASQPTQAVTSLNALPEPCISPFLHHRTAGPFAGTDEDGSVAVTAHFASRVCHPEMVAAARGHLVDGTPIFPGSAFCEMAYAAAEYALPLLPEAHRSSATSTSGMVLTKLEMNRPLIIATDKDDAVVHTVAIATGRGVDVVFSVEAGQETTELGSVSIGLGRTGSLSAKSGPTSIFLVQARCKALVESIQRGAGHTLRRSVIYRLFSRYIGYGEGFQGVQECHLNDDMTEAVASIKLVPALGDRAAANCYWRDTVFHLAGYMLNGHPDARQDEAYIAVAVEGIVFEEELSEEHTYTVYTYMKPTESGAIGDVYVLRGDVLVALCADMVYKRVTIARRGLQHAKAAPATRAMPALTARPPPALTSEQIVAQINPKHSKDMTTSSTAAVKAAPAQTPSKPAPPADKPDVVEHILGYIAHETGWSLDHLTDSTALADLGVDSLMTIVITSKLRSEKGVELASNKIRNCVTVGDIRAEFGSKLPSTKADLAPAPQVNVSPASIDDSSSSASDSWDMAVTPLSMPSSVTSRRSSIDVKAMAPKPALPDDTILNDEYQVEVFLLQGSPDQERPPVFLVPDGSGSITSFLALPNLPSGTCLYGLHSPWVDHPEAFTCTIEQASGLYLKAVRAKQPHGPYIFGGWSAGCVFAYELAKQLLEAGEEVLGLIIIDMHVPQPLPEWIDTTKELWTFWCEATGLKDVFAPLPSGQGLEEHLISNFRALNRYQPMPMASGKTPKRGTLILWATKGMGDVKKEDIGDIPDPLAIGEWFCFDRTDFGPRGWEKLVGDDVECMPIEGNHRSIMVPPDADKLVELIERALNKFLS